jgi:heat shock protein beta
LVPQSEATMRKWALSSALLLLFLLTTLPGPAKKLQVNAEESSDDLANPPKVEEKIGAVPHGLSTDSEVAQRCA